jgi:hypothetical protein
LFDSDSQASSPLELMTPVIEDAAPDSNSKSVSLLSARLADPATVESLVVSTSSPAFIGPRLPDSNNTGTASIASGSRSSSQSSAPTNSSTDGWTQALIWQATDQFFADYI